MLILLTVCHTFHFFLLEFNRFPELSRTSSLFPGLSSPEKRTFQNFPGFLVPVPTLSQVQPPTKMLLGLSVRKEHVTSP